MNILALDTSSKAASCAVVVDGVLLAESFVNAGLTHSQTIMPMVEAMLQNTHVSLGDLDGFAVSTGPGSFTGLRIGIAAVKGMAMALDKPCAGVSTLYGLAASLRCIDGYVVPVMDARRSQVYTALFHCAEGKPERLWQDDALSLEELGERIAALAPAPVLLTGDGAELGMERLAHLKNLRLCPEALRHQRASGVAWAALEEGRFLSGEELAPEYLRLPQAERERLERQKRGEAD